MSGSVRLAVVVSVLGSTGPDFFTPDGNGRTALDQTGPGRPEAANRMTRARALILLSLPLSSIPDDTDAFCSTPGNPDFVLATEHLAHVGTGMITRKALEGFPHRIEAQYRIGAPLRYPHSILPIHP